MNEINDELDTRLNDILKELGPEQVEQMAIQNIDPRILSGQQHVSKREYESILMTAGFLAGIKYMLDK